MKDVPYIPTYFPYSRCSMKTTHLPFYFRLSVYVLRTFSVQLQLLKLKNKQTNCWILRRMPVTKNMNYPKGSTTIINI